MTRSPLHDAFAHHVWATLRVIDTCLALTPEQLETAVPGTYGSIIETVRHLVGADASYLFVATGDRTPEIEEEQMDLAELRSVMVDNGPAWAALLEQEVDPDALVVRHRDDGSDSHAPMGIRLAQAVHHGTDHRSQICTVLTTLGVDPPAIDMWDFGARTAAPSRPRPRPERPPRNRKVGDRIYRRALSIIALSRGYSFPFRSLGAARGRRGSDRARTRTRRRS